MTLNFRQYFIYSLPIPNVLEGLKDYKKRKKAKEALVEGVKRLNSWKPDFIAIPCNTVHLFFETMQKSSSVPMLNIAFETAKKVSEKNYKYVGLLATQTTIQNKIYSRAFENNRMKLVLPSKKEQGKVNNIILNILAGKKLQEDKQALKEIIHSLEKGGAEAIVLGCTDLPLIIGKKDSKIELFDSLEILAEAAVRKAYSST